MAIYWPWPVRDQDSSPELEMSLMLGAFPAAVAQLASHTSYRIKKVCFGFRDQLKAV